MKTAEEIVRDCLHGMATVDAACINCIRAAQEEARTEAALEWCYCNRHTVVRGEEYKAHKKYWAATDTETEQPENL